MPEVDENIITVKKSFPVTGMSCASCAASVETTLKEEKGVINAAVNYANSSASVEYIPGVADVNHFKQSVQSSGYDLMIEDNEEAADALAESKKNNYQILRKRTILSLVFSIPLVLIGMVFMDIPYANYIMWMLGNTGGIAFRTAIFYQCVEAGKTSFRKYGYFGGTEHRNSLSVQCFQYFVSAILDKQGSGCTRLF